MKKVNTYKKFSKELLRQDVSLWQGDVLDLLKTLPEKELFDLVVTSLHTT